MNLFKKAGIAALCGMLIFSAAQPAAVSAREENKAGNTAENKQPQVRAEEGKQAFTQINLSVGDGQETPVFKAEETAVLTINVTNKGNKKAQNVQISPVIENAEGWPFELDQLNYEIPLGDIGAGEQSQAVWGGGDSPLKVKADVTGKTYKLTFRITYSNEEDQKAYETTKYVFVKTEAKKSGESGADKDQGGAQGGSGNDGQDGSAGQAGGSSGGGDSAGADISGGEFYNSDPVPAGGSGSVTDGSVPRVIVTGFETKPGEVKAGSDFKLIIHLKNTSKKTAVSNMLFDIQAPAAGTDAAAEAPAFLPSSGSSSVYLEKIAAGGTKDISIELNARADLVQKPYSITMTMKYEDSSANQFEGESSLAIPVKQEARFEFSEIQVTPDSVSAGDEVNISCNLYNLGRVKMYNVKAKFEGEAIEGQEQFIGNLDSGATGTIDGIVTAVAESYEEANCKLVLTYEDDAGNVSTVENEFTVNVSAMDDMADMMDASLVDMPEEGSGIPVAAILIIIAVVVVGGMVLAAVLIKRKKKKLAAAEEEELSDEVERSAEDERE